MFDFGVCFNGNKLKVLLMLSNVKHFENVHGTSRVMMPALPVFPFIVRVHIFVLRRRIEKVELCHCGVVYHVPADPVRAEMLLQLGRHFQFPWPAK